MESSHFLNTNLFENLYIKREIFAKEDKMRKIRKLSFLGILAVVVAILFLVGISFMQAQVKTQKKPDKPPGKPDKPGEEEATWAVQIPPESGNLWGMETDGSPYEYVNNGKDIIVNVEKKGWKAVGKGGASGIYYMFIFKLVNPTDKYAAFDGVSLNNPIQYEENICVFLGSCGSAVPGCMQCFLNQNHPYSNSEDYDHVYIKFWIYKYDIEAMSTSETYQLGTNSNSDRIRIKTGYTPVNTCSREEPAYHDIICQKYADDGPLNILIKRLGENKWQIYGDVNDLPVKETYCIEEKQKGWVSKTVTTLEATGDFSFMMDFIKKSK